jgi:predicted ATPase
VRRFDEARAAVADAIAGASRPNAVAWCLPELLRVKGQILLQQAREESASGAEVCFKQAGELAREPGALFWEPRIALSLARSRIARGREDEARDILLPVHARFTEGFGTTDLRAARGVPGSLEGGAR